MSLSISSPPMRIEREITMPPSDVTATSVVPPPMSTIIEPVGSFTGRPAPIAAAIGSSTRRAHLDLGDAGRDADDHARTRIEERTLAVHLADEVVEHLLGDVEVADDAVLERTDGDDARRRAPDHPLRLGADREHRAGPLILRDDRRLGDDDPAPAHVHEGVGGAEVDADVP